MLATIDNVAIVRHRLEDYLVVGEELQAHVDSKGPLRGAIEYLSEVEGSIWSGKGEVNLIDRSGNCWDDISGELLDRSAVLKARMEEVEEIRKH